MAFAATVVLPLDPVVLMLISCSKMSRARWSLIERGRGACASSGGPGSRATRSVLLASFHSPWDPPPARLRQATVSASRTAVFLRRAAYGVLPFLPQPRARARTSWARCVQTALAAQASAPPCQTPLGQPNVRNLPAGAKIGDAPCGRLDRAGRLSCHARIRCRHVLSVRTRAAMERSPVLCRKRHDRGLAWWR